MSIAPYLREIGRGKEGARSLTREQAADLMGRLFDGQVSELEQGGFALAMRIKGESAAELLGFMDAAVARLPPAALVLPLGDTPALPPADRPVLLPSYNGARKQPNFTPLLAALLAREGVPVLVHGLLVDPGRVTSAEIFTALGWGPQADGDAVAQAWAQGQPAFWPLPQLHPPLARLLALRRVLGLRNSGHTMAKILPVWPDGLRVVNHTHPEYAGSLGDFLAASGAHAVLMRGTEGEPVADARRLAAMSVFVGGRRRPELDLPAQEGPLRELPVLPAAIDAVTTARHTEAVLAGQVPVPEPIARQVALLLSVRVALRTA